MGHGDYSLGDYIGATRGIHSPISYKNQTINNQPARQLAQAHPHWRQLDLHVVDRLAGIKPGTLTVNPEIQNLTPRNSLNPRPKQELQGLGFRP